jgi:hypothetical protein
MLTIGFRVQGLGMGLTVLGLEGENEGWGWTGSRRHVYASLRNANLFCARGVGVSETGVRGIERLAHDRQSAAGDVGSIPLTPTLAVSGLEVDIFFGH